MKILYTKQELIKEWLAKYPKDANCPDLEHNAIAGYVQNKQGYFYWASYGVDKP